MKLYFNWRLAVIVSFFAFCVAFIVGGVALMVHFADYFENNLWGLLIFLFSIIFIIFVLAVGFGQSIVTHMGSYMMKEDSFVHKAMLGDKKKEEKYY